MEGTSWLLVWLAPGILSTDVCMLINSHVTGHGLDEALDQLSRKLESTPGCVTLSQQHNLSGLPLPSV